MPITTLPTQTEGSLGQVKADSGGPYVAGTDVNAAIVNAWVTRFIELYNEIGKSDGTTVGSINESLNALVAKDVQNNLAGGGAPGISDDDVAGYSARSTWLWNDDGDVLVYICANAATGAAKWIKLAEPGPSASYVTALVGDDGVSPDFARADHVHPHRPQTDDTLHALAVDGTSAGFMSGAQSLALTNLLASVPSPSIIGAIDDFEDERLPGWRVRRHGPGAQIQHLPNPAAYAILPGSGLVFLNVGTDAQDNVTIIKPGVGLVLDSLGTPLVLEWRLCPAASGVYTDNQFAWIVGGVSTPFPEDSTPASLIAFHAQWAGAARNWRFSLWSGGVEISGANVSLPALTGAQSSYRIRITATPDYATLEYAIDEGAFTVLRTLSGTYGGVAWTRATTTATVTRVGHGLTNNDTVNVSDSSDVAAITNSPKVVTVVDPDTFTFTCLDAGAASGTLTYANIPGLAVYSPIAWAENSGGSTGNRTLAIDYVAHHADRYALDAGSPATYDTDILALDALRIRATTAGVDDALSNEDDFLLEVNPTGASGADLLIQLPDPASRRSFRIRKSGTGVETITLVRYGSEKIQNVAASFLLPGSAAIDFPTWHFYANGTDWWML